MEQPKGTIKCERCRTKFTRSDSLKKHLKGYCKGAPKKTFCDDCQKEFHTTWRLKRHFKSVHHGYVGPKCVKSGAIEFSADEDVSPLFKIPVLEEVEEMEEHQPPQTMAEQLPNGGVRLLYADAATQKPFKTSRGFTLSVTSEDGVHFKLEDGAKMWLEAVAGSGAYISLLLAKLCLARWKLQN